MRNLIHNYTIDYQCNYSFIESDTCTSRPYRIPIFAKNLAIMSLRGKSFGKSSGKSFGKPAGKSGPKPAGKREGKSRTTNEDQLKKAEAHRTRHSSSENRSTDRRFSASNKSYQGYNKKSGDRRFAKPLEENADSGLMRINKYMAHAGICSRREAEKYIVAGAVTVNGKVVSELSAKISPSDIVKFNGQTIRGEKKRFILLNKPKDFITTTDDERGRKTVMSLVSNACNERIYPVGRLDRNTTGVLLFTNDGELAKQMIHPKHGVRKIYHVTLDKKLTKHHFEAIVKGVSLEDGPATVDKLSHIEGEAREQVGIELHIGRNRIVRRIFESLGYDVVKLDRVAFGSLTKKQLKRGQWRALDKKEVDLLRML